VDGTFTHSIRSSRGIVPSVPGFPKIQPNQFFLIFLSPGFAPSTSLYNEGTSRKWSSILYGCLGLELFCYASPSDDGRVLLARIAIMQRNTLLIVMVAAGSAMCWWPKIIPPNRDLPGWKTPLVLIALITGLGTALSSEGWRWLLIASLLGGIGGICCGFWLWWPTDGIDASWVPFVIGLSTLTSIPVSIIALFAGVALRDSKIATKNRRLLWGAFLVSFAFAPTVCALTPLLIALRK
jgi:hypothetical protein